LLSPAKKLLNDAARARGSIRGLRLDARLPVIPTPLVRPAASIRDSPGRGRSRRRSTRGRELRPAAKTPTLDAAKPTSRRTGSNRTIRGRGCEHPHRDQLDPSRLEARAGRSTAREPAARRGWSKPVGRAAHKLRSSARDAVRSPAAIRNRDPRSAMQVRTLRAARRPPGEPLAVRRHTAKARPPEAPLVRHYTEAPLALER
jgi:hypothetical protein